jgi:peptidoglycan/LPS O-acetylase OafA/YrhL
VLFGLFEPGLLGILGVAIFFVHTSLVLMQSLARREPYLSDWALHLDFYIRRGFRIYPLSILIVTVVYFFKLPLAHLQPHQLSEGRYGLSVLFANLALVQNCLQNGEILGPLWSLPFEVQMYLVFPALYLMVRAGVGSSAAIFGWAIVCMISLEAARLLPKINAHLAPLALPDMPRVIPMFLPGAIAYANGIRAKRTVSWWWMLVFLAFSMALTAMRVERIRFAFICLGLGVMLPFLRECAVAWLVKVAGIGARYSYGIYLMHYPCMWFAFVVCNGWSLPLQWSIFSASLAVTCFVLYHFVEKPFINLGAAIADRYQHSIRPVVSASADAAQINKVQSS